MDVFLLLKSLLKLSDDDVNKMRVLLAPAAIEGMAGQVLGAVQRMERIEAKLDLLLSRTSQLGAPVEAEYMRQIELFPGEFSHVGNDYVGSESAGSGNAAGNAA